MEFLDRYKKRQKRVFPDASDAPFIENALNKTIVHRLVDGEPGEEPLEAVLIFKDKDGPDFAILYTYAEDGLEIGDTIVRLGTPGDKLTNAFFMIAEEVKRVDGSRVIKVFKLYETNSWVKVNDISLPAYVLSNLKKSIGSDENNRIVTEDKKALMVAPSRYGFQINQYLRFVNFISDEPSYAGWRIEGIDDISSPFLNYIHLKQELRLEETPPIVPDPDLLEPSSIITLESLNGYILTDAAIKIIKRNPMSVEIRLPSSPGVYLFNLKDANGDPREKNIKVG